MSPGKKSLLIIDDDIGIRDGLAVLMGKYFNVDTASSGTEAISKIVQKSYGIYVIDLYLGDMSGFEILKKVRQTDAEAVTIILTAYGNEDDISTAKKLGADEFIFKPIAYNKLYEVINNLLVSGKSSKETELIKQSFYNIIDSISKEITLHLKAVESVADFLSMNNEKNPENLTSISGTLNVAVLEIRKKMGYLKTLSAIKNSNYEDFRSETSFREILKDIMADFNNKNIIKKVVFEDCTFVFYKKTMGYIFMLLLGILQNSKNSILRAYCRKNELFLEIINIEMPEAGLENHPSVEIMLLQGLVAFLNGSMNIKKEGKYSNFTLNISML